MVSKEEVKDMALSVLVGASVVGIAVATLLIGKFWGHEVWHYAQYPAFAVGALVIFAGALVFLWIIGENVRGNDDGFKYPTDTNEQWADELYRKD